MMGSGGAIVMDEDNCMVDTARFYMTFICDESCGKCSPCRIGTRRCLDILNKICDGKGTEQDIQDLNELIEVVRNNSLCALGHPGGTSGAGHAVHHASEAFAAPGFGCVGARSAIYYESVSLCGQFPRFAFRWMQFQ